MPNISSSLLSRIYNKARTQAQGRRVIYTPIRKHHNFHLFG